MDEKQIIKWLLEGDVSIQYQVNRDLLGDDRKDLQNRIANEGWGKQFLSKRNSYGHWGERFYQPKWISTHYTLLDLRNLNLSPENIIIKETIHAVLDSGKSEDGGFNCRTTRSGAEHSSLHTTISVLEGLNEFNKSGSTYRIKDIQNAKASAEEFILLHRLFRSDHTGKIINKGFLSMPYPGRWKYDILRALDYFQYAESKWDGRMEEAISIIQKKRNKNGTWNMQSAHPGQVHLVMENAGSPGRWNTLRVLRVFKQYLL